MNGGEPTQNKYRIISEIYKRAMDIIGDYPILIKISAHDGQKNGVRVDEAVEIAKLLERSGCAGIEVSSGVIEDGLRPLHDYPDFLVLSQRRV